LIKKQITAHQKPGFKKSELGWIPEDWEILSFGDLGTFFKGKGIRKDEVEIDGIPCVRYGELYTIYNNKISEVKSFINSNVAKSSYKLNYGDVLFAGSGETKEEIGKSAVLLRDDTYAGGDIVVLRPKKVDPLYLGYISNTEFVQKQKSLNGQGDAVVHIYSSGLSKVKIPLPPTLKEQKAIAKALSELDELIASLDKLIAKKKAIKQGAMQQLLTGKKRLKEFQTTDKYKQTEVGLIPEDWEIVRLGEIGEFKNGVNKSKEDFGHGKPFVNLMDVFGVERITSVQNLGLVNSTKEDVAIYDLRGGDILFVRSSVKPSGVGLTTVIENHLPEAVFSGFLIRYRTKGLDNEFKFHCFSEKSFRKRLVSSSSVSANTNINQDALKQLSIAVPGSKMEQNSIGMVLSSLNSEIAIFEVKKEKLVKLKQGMMQELLTGKTRLV